MHRRSDRNLPPHRIFAEMKKHHLQEYEWWLRKTNSDGTEWWQVVNTETKRVVSCSSELASYKIVKLAKWMTEGGEKPVNHTTLEKKAKFLIKKEKRRT